MTRLPKLYAPTKIRFSSLRNGLGRNGGVIVDMDVDVERTCRRVLCEGGWKWQLVGCFQLLDSECYQEVNDQEVLDTYGSEIDVEIIKTNQG